MSGPKIIGVFGISGVGKTRLIRNAVASFPDILHLQASALIKQGLSDTSITSEALRQSSGDCVLTNQRVLVAMFDQTIAASHARLIIFDGHLIIDTDAELIEIPLEVIAAMRPAVMIHVEAAPELIIERRQQDVTRARPQRTTAAIAEHQHRSRDLCRRYAAAVDVRMCTVADGFPAKLRGICAQLLIDRFGFNLKS